MDYQSPGPDDSRISWMLGQTHEAQQTLDAAVIEARNLPDTEPSKAARISRLNSLKREVDTAFTSLTGDAKQWASNDIPSLYTSGWFVGGVQSGTGFDFSLPHRDALHILSLDAYKDVATNLQQVNQKFANTADLQKIYEGMDPGQILAIQDKSRSAVAQALLTGEADPRKVASGLADELWEDGVTIVDGGGNKWQMETYTRMLVRTKSANAYNSGSLNKFAEEGVTRVKVFDGTQDDEECAEANDQTWSTEYAMNHPIQHPNCRRAFAPVAGTGPVNEKTDGKAGKDNVASVMNTVRDANEKLVGALDLYDMISDFYNTGEVNFSGMIAKYTTEKVFDLTGLNMPQVEKWVEGGLQYSLKNVDTYIESYVDPLLFSAGLLKSMPARAELLSSTHPQALMNKMATTLRKSNIEAFGQDVNPKIAAIAADIDAHGRVASKRIRSGSDAVAVLTEAIGYGHSASIGAVPMDHFGKVTVEIFQMVLTGKMSEQRLAGILRSANTRVVDLREIRVAHLDLVDASTDEALVIRADLDKKIKRMVGELGDRKGKPYDPQVLEDMLTVEGVQSFDRSDRKIAEMVIDMKKARAEADMRFTELVDMRIGNTGRTAIPVDDVIEGTLRRTTTTDTGGMADVIDLDAFRARRWNVNEEMARSQNLKPAVGSTHHGTVDFTVGTAQDTLHHTHDHAGPHELLMAAADDTKFLSHTEELWDEAALDRAARDLKHSLSDGTVTTFDTEMYAEFTEYFRYVENLGPRSKEFDELSRYINVPKPKKQTLTTHLGITNETPKWKAFKQYRESMESLDIDAEGIVRVNGERVAVGGQEMSEIIEVRKWLNSKYFAESDSWQMVTAKSSQPELLTRKLAPELTEDTFVRGVGVRNEWDALLNNMKVLEVEPKPTTYRNLEESLHKAYGPGNVSILGESGVNGDLYKVVDADGNVFLVKKIDAGHAGSSGSVPYSLKLNDWLANELGNVESVPSRVVSINDVDEPLTLIPFVDQSDTWFSASGGKFNKAGQPNMTKLDPKYIGESIDENQLRKFSLFDDLSMEGDAHMANVMINQDTGVATIIDREKSFRLYAGRKQLDNGIDGLDSAANNAFTMRSFDAMSAGEELTFGGNAPAARLIKLSDAEKKAVGFAPNKLSPEAFHASPQGTWFVRRGDDLYLPAGRQGHITGRAWYLGDVPKMSKYLDDDELRFAKKAMHQPNKLVDDIAEQMHAAAADLNADTRRKFTKKWKASTFDEAVDTASKQVGANMTKRVSDLVDGGAYNITGGTTRTVSRNNVIVETGSTVRMRHRDTGEELSGLVAGIFEDSSGKMKAQVVEGFGLEKTADELAGLGSGMKAVDLDEYVPMVTHDLLQAVDTGVFVDVGGGGDGLLRRMKNWPVERMSKLRDDAAALGKQQEDAWRAFEKAADANFAEVYRRADAGEITPAEAKRLHGGFVEEWKYVPPGHEELLQAADGAPDLSVTERRGFLKRIRDRHRALNENRRGRWENLDNEVMAHWEEMVKKIDAGELTEAEAYRLNVQFAEEWEYVAPPTSDELLFAPLKKIQDKNRAKHGDFWAELDERRFRERAMPREKWDELNQLYEDGVIDEAGWDRLMEEATDDAFDARSLLDEEFNALNDARRAGEIDEKEMVDGFEELVNAVLDAPIPIEEQHLLLAQAEKGVNWDVGARDGPLKKFIKKQQRMKNDWQRSLNEADDRLGLISPERKIQLDDLYERKEIDINEYEAILERETSGAYTQFLREEDVPYGNRFAGDVRKQLDGGVPEPLPDISTINSPHVQLPVLDETGILIGYDEKMISYDVRGMSKRFRYQYQDLKGKNHVGWQDTKLLDDKAKDVVNAELMKLPPEQRPTKVHFQMDPIRTKDNRIAYGMYNPDTKELHLTWSSALKDDLVEVAPGRGAVDVQKVGNKLSADTIVDDAFDWDKFRGVVQHELGHATETSLEDTVHHDVVAKVWLDLLEKNPDVKSKAAFEDLAYDLLGDGSLDRGETALQALIDARVREIEDVQNTKLFNATTQLFEEAMETRTTWEELPDWLWYSHGVMEQNNTVAHHEFFADLTKQINKRGGGELGMKRVADELNVDVKYLDQYFDRRIVLPDDWDTSSKVYRQWYAEELDDVSGNIVRRRGRGDRDLLLEIHEPLGEKRARHIEHVIDNDRRPLVSDGFLRETYEYESPDLGVKTGDVVVDIDSSGEAATIEGTIFRLTKDGTAIRVGDFERWVTRLDDGTWEIYHSSFFLDPSEQGTGFGKLFSDHMEDMYISRGVSRITLEAAHVGRYYWARRGFEFKDPERQMGDLISERFAQAGRAIIRSTVFVNEKLDFDEQRRAAAEIFRHIKDSTGVGVFDEPLRRILDSPRVTAAAIKSSNLAWEGRPRWSIHYNGDIHDAIEDVEIVMRDPDVRAFLESADGVDLQRMDDWLAMARVGAVETVPSESIPIELMFGKIPKALINATDASSKASMSKVVRLVTEAPSGMGEEVRPFMTRVQRMWADLTQEVKITSFDDAVDAGFSAEAAAVVHGLRSSHSAVIRMRDVGELSAETRAVLVKLRQDMGDEVFTKIIRKHLDEAGDAYAPRVLSQTRKAKKGSAADQALEDAVAMQEALQHANRYGIDNEITALGERTYHFEWHTPKGATSDMSGAGNLRASQLAEVGRETKIDVVGKGVQADESWIGKQLLLTGGMQDMVRDLEEFRPASIKSTRHVPDIVDFMLWHSDPGAEILKRADGANYVKLSAAPIPADVRKMAANDWRDLTRADPRAERALTDLNDPDRFARLEKVLTGDLPMTPEDADTINYLDELLRTSPQEFLYTSAPDGALAKVDAEFLNVNLQRETVMYGSDRPVQEWLDQAGKDIINDLYTPSRVIDDGEIAGDVVAVHWLPSEAGSVRFVPTEDGGQIAVFPRGAKFTITSVHEVEGIDGATHSMINLRLLGPPNTPAPPAVADVSWVRRSKMNASLGQGYDVLEDGKYYRLAHEDGTVVYEGLYDASKQVEGRTMILSDASRDGVKLKGGYVDLEIDKALGADGLTLYEAIPVSGAVRPAQSGTQFVGYSFSSPASRSAAHDVLVQLNEELMLGYQHPGMFDYNEIVERVLSRNHPTLKKLYEDMDDIGIEIPDIFSADVENIDRLVGKLRAAAFGGTYYDTVGYGAIRSTGDFEPVVRRFVTSSEATSLRPLWSELATKDETTRSFARTVTLKLKSELDSGRVSASEFSENYDEIVRRLINDVKETSTLTDEEADLFHRYFMALNDDLDRLVNSGLTAQAGLQRAEGTAALLRYHTEAHNALFTLVDVPDPPSSVPQLLKKALDGGFVVDTAGRDHWSGISLRRGRNQVQIALDDMTERQLWEYLDSKSGLIEGHDNLRFAGWSEDGFFYMDVVEVFDTRQEEADALIEAARVAFAKKKKKVAGFAGPTIKTREKYGDVYEFTLDMVSDVYPGGLPEYIVATQSVIPLRTKPGALKTLFTPVKEALGRHHWPVSMEVFNPVQYKYVFDGLRDKIFDPLTGKALVLTQNAVNKRVEKFATAMLKYYRLGEEVRLAPALDVLDELDLDDFIRVMGDKEDYKFIVAGSVSEAERVATFTEARQAIMRYKRRGLTLPKDGLEIIVVDDRKMRQLMPKGTRRGPVDNALTIGRKVYINKHWKDRDFHKSVDQFETIVHELAHQIDDGGGWRSQKVWDELLVLKSGKIGSYKGPSELSMVNASELWAEGMMILLTHPLEEPRLAGAVLTVLQDGGDLQHGRLWRETARFYEVWNARFIELEKQTGIPMERIAAAAAGMSAGLDADQNLKIVEWMARRVAKNPPLTEKEARIVREFVVGKSESYFKFADDEDKKLVAAKKRLVKHTEAGTLGSKKGQTAVRDVEKLSISTVEKRKKAEWMSREMDGAIKVGQKLFDVEDDFVGHMTIAALIDYDTGGRYTAGGRSSQGFINARHVMSTKYDIEEVLGDSKYRSFYNNILDPLDAGKNGDFTADFWMMQIGMFMFRADGAGMDTPKVMAMAVGLRPVIADAVRKLFGEVNPASGIPWKDEFGVESVAGMQEVLWAMIRTFSANESHWFELAMMRGTPWPVAMTKAKMTDAEIPITTGRRVTKEDKSAIVEFADKDKPSLNFSVRLKEFKEYLKWQS